MFKEFIFLFFTQFITAEELPTQTEIVGTKSGSLTGEFTLSTGLTYVSFEQSFLNQGISDLSFDSFKLPYFDASFKAKLNEDLEYTIHILKYTPIETDSGDSLAVAQKTLNLWSTGVELSHQHSSLKRESLKWLRLTTLFGFKFQQFPLLQRTGTNTIEGSLFSSTLLSLGVTLKEDGLSEKWDHLVTTRLYYPLMNSGSSKLSSPLLFDLELGSYYNINVNWKIGAFWFLQMQNYKVSSSEIDPVSSTTLEAKQNNIYSSIFARLFYQW